MNCQICNNSNLKKILDLPSLPFTGVFVSKAEKTKTFNQSLLYCDTCGHAQLENFISPNILYNESYSHRGSKSSLAVFGNDFFYQFLLKNAKNKQFNTAVDLGCNDLYLLKKISGIAKNLYGIDPIWKEKDIIDNINVRGKLIENIDLAKEIKNKPDLIVSSHTFEHINDPRVQLQKLVSFAKEAALFIIEVPSFDTLVRNHRFDQVFHQHCQYFSLSSMKKLIDLCECTYLSHIFNYNFWGGTMLFAFKKGKQKDASTLNINFKPISINKIQDSYSIFKELLKNLMNRIQIASDKKLFGYGAAQMLPILAYHMKTDLDFLECIFDDNERKDNLMYPDLKPKIKYISDKTNLENKDILLLALDSVKSIIPQLIRYYPRKIIVPLDIA